jgi:hypothetical protein
MIQFFKRLASEVENSDVDSVTLFVDDNGLPAVKDESGTVTAFAVQEQNTGSIQESYFTQITADDTPVVISTSTSNAALARYIIVVQEESTSNNATFELKAYNKAASNVVVDSDIDAALVGITATVEVNGDIEVTGLSATSLKWAVYVKTHAFDTTFPE